MTQHVIWKRPDGFQNACPEDFRRIGLSNGAQLWLHRHEVDWYPFQVSGDWSGEQDTKKLNRLINMLDATKTAWKSVIEHMCDDELDEASGRSLSEVAKTNVLWLQNMQNMVRGDSWEIEIIRCALGDIIQKLNQFV